MAVDVKVEGLEDILTGLDKRKEYVAKAVNSTCKEFKSRAPGWINRAAAHHYTIKDKEVKDSLKAKHNCGTTVLGGITLDDIRLEYRGRVLTFAHFTFSPKNPGIKLRKKRTLIPGQRTTSESPVVWAYIHRTQRVTVTVKRGHKEILKGKYLTTPFIASMNGSPVMPFQRTAQKNQTVKSMRSVSIPQMISNEKVAADINYRIDRELGKRLQHHLDRYSNK